LPQLQNKFIASSQGHVVDVTQRAKLSSLANKSRSRLAWKS
jgi:hypothetical protein